MKRQLSALAALALFAIACSEPTSIDRSLIGTVPSLDVSAVDQGVITAGVGLTAGQVRLCKTTPAGDPALTWRFTIAAETEIGTDAPVAPTSPVTIVGVSGQTVCTATPVFTSTKEGAELDQLTIVEVGTGASDPIPANWATTHIHVDLYDDGPGYDPPAPGMTVTGDLTTRTVVLYINNDMERVVTFTNDFTEPVGNEGCTPGYWKQDQHLDSWVGTGYTTGTTLESVFDVPNAFGIDNSTFLDALSFKGGNTLTDAAKLLLHHAVAALLNAGSPDVDYGMTEADIIADVNAALASGDRDTILDLKADLDALNNAGCPIN